MIRAKCEYVYVMRGVGRNKIGIAADVDRRFTELRRDGAKEIARTWHRPEDASAIEYAVKRLLDGKCVKGEEWFGVPLKRMVKTVERAIEMVEAGDASLQPTALKRKRLADKEVWWAEYRAELERLAEACLAEMEQS